MNTRSGKLHLGETSNTPKKTKKKQSNKPEIIEQTTTFLETPQGQPPPVGMANPDTRFNEPMWNKTRTLAPTPGSAIIKPDMGANFAVKGNHIKMIQENQFDGHYLSDPYKHIANFEEICEMFRYGPNTDEPVKLRLFSLSLTGESKNWFNELETGSIETWAQMKDAFAHRFFPPGLAQKLINDIRSFKQNEKENLIDAWIRLQNMVRKCHGHGLDKEQIIHIFYYGLDEDSQILLDSAGGGIFLYKSANDACKIMEDKVTMRMSKSRVDNNKPIKKVVAFAESRREESDVVAKLDVLVNRIDDRFSKMEKDLYALKYGCEHCGGSHNSDECDIPGDQVENANYVQNNYQGNNQRWGQFRNQGNFNSSFNSNTNNFPSRYPRNNQNDPYPQKPRDDRQQQSLSKPNEEEITLSSLQKLVADFIETQKSTNDLISSRLEFLKKNLEQNQRNNQASINELERSLDRLSDKNNSRPIGTLPSNTQQNPRPITPPGQGAPSSNSNIRYQPPPVKNEHVNAIFETGETYCSNVVSTGSTNALLLVSEQVRDDFEKEKAVVELDKKNPQTNEDSTSQLTAWTSKSKEAVIRGVKTIDSKKKNAIDIGNNLPPKLGDPGSFLISCCFDNTVIIDGMADLGASINLMSYSLYKNLSLGPLKPSTMTIQLADRSSHNPLGIAENVILKVGSLTFRVDFVVLKLVEDTNVPIILGRPFLHTANAVVHVRKKIISLGIGSDRMTFKVNKSKSQPGVTNQTCFNLGEEELMQGAEDEPEEPDEMAIVPAQNTQTDEQLPDSELSISELERLMGPLEMNESGRQNEERNQGEQEGTHRSKVLEQIENFQQGERELISDAWQRMMKLVRTLPENSITKEECVHYFYLGLEGYGQHSLDSAAGGSFLSILSKFAFRILQTGSYDNEYAIGAYQSSDDDEPDKEKGDATVESSPNKPIEKGKNIVGEPEIKVEAHASGEPIYTQVSAVLKVLAFKQAEKEHIDDAWRRMNALRQACKKEEFRDHHYLSLFYHGLQNQAQETLNKATNGFFLFQKNSEAFKMLNERTYDQKYQEFLAKAKEEEKSIESLDLNQPPKAMIHNINTNQTQNKNQEFTNKNLMKTMVDQAITFGKVQEKLWNLLSDTQTNDENTRLEIKVRELINIHLASPFGRLQNESNLLINMLDAEKQITQEEFKRRKKHIDEAECSKKRKLVDLTQDDDKAESSLPKVCPNLPNTSSVGEFKNNFL